MPDSSTEPHSATVERVNRRHVLVAAGGLGLATAMRPSGTAVARAQWDVEDDGDARFRTTRDIATDEVIVTAPGATLFEDEFYTELSPQHRYAGRVFLPGDAIDLEATEPTALSAVVVAEGTLEEDGLETLTEFIGEAHEPWAEVGVFPGENLFSDHIRAVDGEQIIAAVDMGMPRGELETLLENSGVVVPLEGATGISGGVETLKAGDVAFRGDWWLPDETWIPGGTSLPDDTWMPGDTWASSDRWTPGEQWFPQETWLPGESEAFFKTGVAFSVDDDQWAEANPITRQGGVVVPAGTWADSQDPSDATRDQPEDEAPAESDDGGRIDTEDGLPGFGVTGALLGVGGIATLLARRLGATESNLR